jgi:preprotein translocase subunit SecD
MRRRLQTYEAAVDEGFPSWDRSSLPGVPNSYLLTLKTSVERQIRTSSVQQAIQTIRNRVDQLGVTSRSSRSTVPLKSIKSWCNCRSGRPTRVKDIIKSTALTRMETCGTRRRTVSKPRGCAFTVRWSRS